MTDTEQSDTVQFHKDANGDWRWTVKAKNHEVIAAATEGYVNKTDAVANYERVTGRKTDG